jgi:L-ascorbate metabolism protein UlaG (beta-lactamase superfamily)
MYRIEIGDTRIGVIGNIDEKLSDEQLEELGVIDILILPIGGGGYTLDGNAAAGLVRMISPKIVIPIHYYDQSLEYEVPQDDLKLFIAELGAPVEVMPKFKSKQASITLAPLSVIELTRS